MTVIEQHAPAPEAPAPAPPAAQPWWARPILHVGLLVVILGVLLAVTDLEASWTSDDGAYAVQTELVRETGEWEYPNRHPQADPLGAALPIALSGTTTDGRSYPYAKQPLWIEVLVASTERAGPVVGLHLPAVAGVLFAALTALALARRLIPGRELLAFWAVGLGPLLVQATALWAHTMAAALGGILALLVARSARLRPPGPRPTVARELPWAVGGACTALLLPLVRSEGLLTVAAAALVLGVLAVREASWPARVGRGAVAAGVALGGLLGQRLNGRWTASIYDSDLQASLDSPDRAGLLAGRVQGAARTFLDGAGTDRLGTLLALVGVALAFGAGRALARADRQPAIGLAVASLGVLALRTLVAGEADLGGLLVAAPVLAAAVGACSLARMSRPARATLAYVALTLLAVLAVQYPEGGGREWGGRFALTVAVPATVLAVGALSSAWARTFPGASHRRVGMALLAAAVVLPTVGGLWATRQVASESRAAADRIAAVDEAPVIITARYVPRLGWRHLPEEDWLLGRPGEVEDLLVALRPTVTGPVVVYGGSASEVSAPGYRREVRSDIEVVFHPVP